MASSTAADGTRGLDSTSARDSAAAPSVGRTRAESGFLLLLLCFFLSGLAALIYQTAWTRQFAFVFGTSELAIATVLAAYMGGLAGGAALGGRLVLWVRRPVLAYGILELGIALAALAVPVGIRASTALYVALFGARGAPPGEAGLVTALFYLVCSFAVLLVPTLLMGATLPLLARYAVRDESQIGSRIGLLYATNTVGAVAGTVITGFLLLPNLGLGRTIWVAVAANGLVFAAACLLDRRAAPVPALAAVRSIAASGRIFWILPLMLLSGAVSFSYEVLWSRLLAHVLGGSVYAFSTMLGSFLTGIALGSLLASRLATTRARALHGFGWAQLGTALASWLAFYAVDRMPALTLAIGAQGSARLAADAAVAALTLLPATLCIGATFPFAVRILARDEADAAPASARVYSWNTLGAILGAVGAGFFLVPALGYSGMLTLSVAANLALALLVTTVVSPERKRSLAAAAAVGLALLLLVPPAPPWQLLRSSAMQLTPAAGKLVYLGVGRSSTVLLLDGPVPGFPLRTNGLPESTIPSKGDRPTPANIARLLGAVPTLARPEARSLLVIGLGGGIVLESVPSPIESIDVVELEPEVVKANRLVADRRREDPLSDPRVNLITNDARGALVLTEKRYDGIVSQPSHPWTAGASHLYTREFFELVRRHLNRDGVFVQWMGLHFVDEFLLRSLVATLLDVFPHVRLLSVHGGVLFVASGAPLPIEEVAARGIAAAPEDFAQLGIVRPEDVVAALVLTEEGARRFAEGGEVSTDDHNLLQIRSPRVFREGSMLKNADALFAPHDPLVEPTPEYDRLYLVRRLLSFGERPRARRVAVATKSPVERPTAIALVHLSQGRRGRAARALEAALDRDPQALSARIELLRLRREGLCAGDPDAEWLGDGVVGVEAAVLDGWCLESGEDWERLRGLDTSLAGVPVDSPLYRDAVRLRASWRLESGAPQHGREAVAIVDEMFPRGGTMSDVVMRARGLGLAGDSEEALRALFQVSVGLKGEASHREIAREALRVLGELPAYPGSRRLRAQVSSRLQNLIAQSESQGAARGPG